MITSRAIEVLTPLFDIINRAKGKTIGEIKQELNEHARIMKKGASGMIVEGLLGIAPNNTADADIPEIGCEVKVLPIQVGRNGEIKAKEPTQIQMINYFEVAAECWEIAKIRKKINFTLWIVYLAKEGGKALPQDDYKIVDFYIDHPAPDDVAVFKEDWELIKSYIVRGDADKLSCSMGQYIEPKTKGANNQDKTNAPDGKGGVIRARRRAFYYKKRYTNTHIISQIDKSVIEN